MRSLPRLDFIYLMVLICLLSTVESCRSTDDNQNTSVNLSVLVDSIKNNFIPDRRVQIFDYYVSRDGTRIVGKSSNPDAYAKIQQITKVLPGLNLDSFYLIQPLDTAIINVSVGNMRSNPRHSAELSSQVLMGHHVTVWDKKGSWYYIQTPDKYLGWIDSGALVFGNQDRTGYLNTEKVMYGKDFGFCYENPDKQGNVISDLVAGDILGKMDEMSKYTQVILPDGRKGYVLTDETRSLKNISRTPLPDWSQIKETAFKFMGRPYLWGGTSGKGVDCSGFTKMVYYLNGLEIPRDASQQVHSGNEIPIEDDFSQLRPGDFLFFGKKGERGEKDKVTHVAIYIGDGRMIHASERVQVESLKPEDPDYAPQRRKTLLTARRMMDDGIAAQGIQQIKNNPSYGF